MSSLSRHTLTLLTIALLQGLPALSQRNYDLPEVEVSGEKRDVLCLTAYVSEYSTLTSGSDTVALFREKIVDFMIPSPRAKCYRGWRRPRPLASRSYYQFLDHQGLDSVSDSFSRHFSWSDWVGIADRLELPDGVSHTEVGTDTIYGPYSRAQLWSREADRIHVEVDLLADTTDHRWTPGLRSLLTSGPEFTRFYMRYNFSDAGQTELTPDNLDRVTYNIDSDGRSRGFFNMFGAAADYQASTYAEVTIVDRRYLTVAQARRYEKNGPRGADAWAMMEGRMPELDDDVKLLMARVNALDKTALRKNIKPDERLAGIDITKKKKGGILGFLKTILK